MSDNGPCFNSKEWQDFAKAYDFNHVTSSPLYAQSNGKAEKGVYILKQLLKKAADSSSDPYLALLSYRASPFGVRAVTWRATDEKETQDNTSKLLEAKETS